MLKKNQPTETDKAKSKRFLKEHLLKEGVKFNHVLMTTQQLMEEVYLSKRVLQHYRDEYKLSVSWAFGKCFYIREEIAEMLAAHIFWRRTPKDPPKKK